MKGSLDPIGPGDPERDFWIELIEPSEGKGTDKRPGDLALPVLSEFPTQFIAVLHQGGKTADPETIISRVNFDKVDNLSFNPDNGEIVFSAVPEKSEGKFMVDIWAGAYEGRTTSAFWAFRVDTTPPAVKAVFPGKTASEVLVSFDEPVEEDWALDRMNWQAERIEDEDEDWEKRTELPVSKVEIVDGRRTLVRLKLGEEMLDDMDIGREFSFYSSRGESKFRLDGRNLAEKKWRRKREIADLEYLTTECADFYDPSTQWNIVCEDPPGSTCAWGTTRWGDCWRTDGDGHTHQSEESEDHCAGMEMLGVDVACMSPCIVDWCYEQFEYCAVNDNLGESYWNIVGNDEDDEQLVDELFFREQAGPGWGAFSFQPDGSFDRSMTLYYHDKDWDYCDTGTIVHQWDWELEGDTYNPVFLDQESNEKVAIVTTEAAGEKALEYGLDPELYTDCMYILIEIEDRGFDETLGWMGDIPYVTVGVSGEEESEREFGPSFQPSAYMDLGPITGTSDVDGESKERWLYLICIDQVLLALETWEFTCEECTECAADWYFMATDDLGNWKVEELYTNRVISDENPDESFIRILSPTWASSGGEENPQKIYVNWDPTDEFLDDHWGRKLQFEVGVRPTMIGCNDIVVWYTDPDEPDRPSSNIPTNSYVYVTSGSDYPGSYRPYDGCGKVGERQADTGNDWVYNSATQEWEYVDELGDDNQVIAQLWAANGSRPEETQPGSLVEVGPTGELSAEGFAVYRFNFQICDFEEEIPGDNYIIHAGVTCQNHPYETESAMITVWRRFWYQRDFMKEAYPSEVYYQFDPTKLIGAFDDAYYELSQVDSHNYGDNRNPFYKADFVPYCDTDADGFNWQHQYGLLELGIIERVNDVPMCGGIAYALSEHSAITVTPFGQFPVIMENCAIHEFGHLFLTGDEDTDHSLGRVMATPYSMGEDYFSYWAIHILRANTNFANHTGQDIPATPPFE